MDSARRLYRVTLAVAVLGALALIAVVAAALSTLTLAVPSSEELAAACGRLLPEGLSALGAAVMGLAGLSALALARGVRSAVLETQAQLRVRARLHSAAKAELHGERVRTFPSSRPQAFCAGLLRPRIFLSESARDRLSEMELRAVLAHEEHHVIRRDPMRVLCARVLADALFFVPGLRRLERRYGELAELAADEAAVRAAGSAALASALLKLGGSGHPEGAVALAPERVDHLCGAAPRWRLEPRVLALSLLAVTGTGAAAVLAGVAAGGVRVELLMVVVHSCMALMLAVAVAFAGQLWRRAKAQSKSGS